MNDLPSVPGMPLVIEVDTPKPSDLPERAQQILCLKACGFGVASIARLCKVTASAVTKYIQSHDPEGAVTLTQSERKKFLATLWEARGGEALLHMTPEKMEEATVGELARVASMAIKSVDALQTEEEEKVRDPYSILKQLGPSA